jgi:hypothetical protein
MPVTSTLLDQAHNALDRKLFMMKAFHHPKGSQRAFLTGLAHLYNLIPYQHRAKHAGQCGVEVEGGRVPTRDWFLNLCHHLVEKKCTVVKTKDTASAVSFDGATAPLYRQRLCFHSG